MKVEWVPVNTLSQSTLYIVRLYVPYTLMRILYIEL